MSNTSTSEQVLYNPELLECILLHLPERDLLVNAQRVSQLWNAIITTSPTLQRILYFQPFPSEDSIKCTVNPILLLLFFPWFRSFERDTPPDYIKRLDFRNLDWNSSNAKQEAYRRKDASWRRMLVVQPPVLNIYIARKYYIGGPTETFKGKVKILEGM
jgi:hypothetical protein